MSTEYWNVDIMNDELGQPWGTAMGSIFRCPDHIREASPSCYEPKVLTLGPYASKKASKYAWLDTQKLNVARATVLSKGNSPDGMADLVTHLGGTPDEIKLKFGSKPVMEIKEVQRMLAVDSLFVAGILVKVLVSTENFPSFVKDDDSWQTCLKSFPGFGEDEPASRAFRQGLDVIFRDLLLLENQIPIAFLKRALIYAVPNMTDQRAEELLSHSVGHLIRCTGFILNLDAYSSSAVNSINLSSCEHMLHFYYLLATGLSNEDKFAPSDIGYLDLKLPTISELKLFGLGLKSEPGNLKTAWFGKGASTIHLPQIIVNNVTETLIRNLLAFEFLAEKPPVVSSYVIMMDHLIDTVSDVQIMKNYHVVENFLGDDESVRDMWNGFARGDLYILDFRAEEFTRIMNARNIIKILDVRAEEFTRIINARNIIKKNLWDIYRQTCSSLYLILALVAAVLLLVCAFLQTLYTLRGYFHSKEQV